MELNLDRHSLKWARWPSPFLCHGKVGLFLFKILMVWPTIIHLECRYICSLEQICPLYGSTLSKSLKSKALYANLLPHQVGFTSDVLIGSSYTTTVWKRQPVTLQCTGSLSWLSSFSTFYSLPSLSGLPLTSSSAGGRTPSSSTNHFLMPKGTKMAHHKTLKCQFLSSYSLLIDTILF